MGKRNNSFSAKVKIDVQNGTLIEETKKEYNVYSIDKLAEEFPEGLTVSVSDLTSDELKQILAIVHGKEDPISLSIRKDESIEHLLAEDTDEE